MDLEKLESLAEKHHDNGGAEWLAGRDYWLTDYLITYFDQHGWRPLRKDRRYLSAKQHLPIRVTSLTLAEAARPRAGAPGAKVQSE